VVAETLLCGQLNVQPLLSDRDEDSQMARHFLPPSASKMENRDADLPRSKGQGGVRGTEKSRRGTGGVSERISRTPFCYSSCSVLRDKWLFWAASRVQFCDGNHRPADCMKRLMDRPKSDVKRGKFANLC
jgi:hypothetical protein